MSIAMITGSAGLIGSEAARYFASLGMAVVGIDNDMRSYFFGPEGSTVWQRQKLEQELGRHYLHLNTDIRNAEQLEQLFRKYADDIELIIHVAAQPSHDWEAKEPQTDFSVYAVGTLNLLELLRNHRPEVRFIFTSTNKVYGDTPNRWTPMHLDNRTPNKYLGTLASTICA